jgi:hypothetical protein
MATDMAKEFGDIKVRRPWLGKCATIIEKSKKLDIEVGEEEDSYQFVEWMRTRPNGGFLGVEDVNVMLHPTSFRPITTMNGFARAFPNVRRIIIESSGDFEIPHELVFPAKGLDNLEHFEAILPETSECWLEVFAGYPRPSKLRHVCVRAKDY